MLTIRHAQLLALEADVRRRTKRRLVAELRAATRAPQPPLPGDDELHALLDRCEARIDRYDGHFGDDAPRHLRLSLAHGEDWPDQPWARSVFDDPAIPGTSKLDVIDVHLAARRAATGES
jgi:hypothetical protein